VIVTFCPTVDGLGDEDSVSPTGQFIGSGVPQHGTA
jgi:hypothetical protein